MLLFICLQSNENLFGFETKYFLFYNMKIHLKFRL